MELMILFSFLTFAIGHPFHRILDTLPISAWGRVVRLDMTEGFRPDR